MKIDVKEVRIRLEELDEINVDRGAQPELTLGCFSDKCSEYGISDTSFCKTKCPNNCYENVCIKYLRAFEKKRIVFGRRGTRA